MTFNVETHVPLLHLKPTHIHIEEVGGLWATIKKLTKENEELQRNLHLVTNEKNEFKWKLERKKMQPQINVEKMDK